LLSISDSTALRSYYTATRRDTKEYKPELGYELMSIINFPINDKLSIRTGLGINLNRFTVGSKNPSTTARTLISSDTISYITSTSPLSPSNYCGSYKNDISKFEINNDLQYTFINLRIPLEASIALIDSKLCLNLGVYMQTPIVSNKYREYISLERELVGNEYECEYIKHEESDKSGGNSTNLIFGYSVSAEYKLSKCIAFEIGALRDFGNTFYNSPNTFSSSFENLTVTRYSIGLRYNIGKKKISE